MSLFNRVLHSSWLGLIVFYGWNIFFIIVLVALESDERIFSELFYNVFTSYTPISYLWITLALCLTPIACLIVGWVRLKNKGTQLLKWFYGFQVPLGFLLIFRLAGFNQVTNEIMWWFLALILPIAGYGIRVIWNKQILGRTSGFFQTFQIFLGLGFALYIAIYAVPMAWIALVELFENITNIPDLLELGALGFLLLLFFTLTGTLLVFAPIAIIKFYAFDNLREIIKEKDALNHWTPHLIGVICLTFLVYPREQSQIEALSLSDQWFNEEITDSEILDHTSELKTGLINAYLWRYRYVGSNGRRYRAINSLYREAFDSDSSFVIQLHDALIHPFIYQGSYEDQELAAEYYEQIFDTPIERAEKDEIIDAMRNTFRLRNVEATIMSVDQKQVEVTNRDISYNEISKGIVEVEFHERYINRTYRNQEVFYYFSIPQNTVITGMWLSDDDEDIYKYKHTVAPRGAAQKTYDQIKAVRRDPSLLEQVGPYQYRLRVFPIPPRFRVRFDNRNSKIAEEESPMHLTLTLLSKTDENGAIHPPMLTEKRNVFWKDGALLGCADDQWFPTPEQTFSPTAKTGSDRFDDILVETKLVSSLTKTNEQRPLTIILDGSYSMGQHKDDLQELVNRIPNAANSNLLVLSGNELTEPSTPLSEFPYVGNNNIMSVLPKWAVAHAGERVLWITDKGSYELLQEDSVNEAISTDIRIDVLHLNGFAPIYDDAFVESVLGSGGTMYTNMDDWIAWSNVDESQLQKHYWPEGDLVYSFDSATVNGAHPFAPYLASRLAAAKSRSKGRLSVSELDELHGLAMKYSFVSPFSSMICLVDEEQKKLLEELSNREDRFERAVETGKTSGNMELMASPEPHEWFMIIALLLLMTYVYRDRLIRLQQSIRF